MRKLRIDLRTCDVGAAMASPEEFVAQLTERTLQSWDSGADVVLWPEFSWLGLERFAVEPGSINHGGEPLRRVSELFWKQIWPDLAVRLHRADKAVVLGTVPWVDEVGRLHNRAPIVAGGHVSFQDKLNLTPWEEQFTGGEGVRVFEFGGVKFAVVICLDIEVPEISVALRGKGVDLLLVPSATESILGVERVGRCASARSVELGCYVGVCHLVGKGESSLVDENVGRLAWFSPSQTPFAKEANESREVATQVFVDGFECLSVVLDPAKLTRMRKRRAETNPAFLSTSLPKILDAFDNIE